MLKSSCINEQLEMIFSLDGQPTGGYNDGSF